MPLNPTGNYYYYMAQLIARGMTEAEAQLLVLDGSPHVDGQVIQLSDIVGRLNQRIVDANNAATVQTARATKHQNVLTAVNT